MRTFIFILFCTISSSALAARIAVVYHSGYGHTEVIAKAVYEGTLEIKGTESKLIKVSPEGKIPEEAWQILEKSDAIVFGAPTYMGSLSGPFKMFIDTTSKIFLEQTPIAKGSFVGLTFLIHLQSFSDNIFSALFLISDNFFGTDKL